MILIKLKTDKNKILAAMISATQQGDEEEGGLVNRVDKQTIFCLQKFFEVALNIHPIYMHILIG